MKKFMLTFDVEQNCPPFDSGYEGVKYGLPKILDILDELNIKSTMFITGRSAEMYPNIIKRASKKHEIQCHTYNHEILEDLSYDEQFRSISKCKKILENLTGKKIYGFRAPYARFNRNTFKVLHKLDFKYDSSMISKSTVGKGLPFVRDLRKNILDFIIYPNEKATAIKNNIKKFILATGKLIDLDEKNKRRLLYYGLMSFNRRSQNVEEYMKSLGIHEVEINLRSMIFRSPIFTPKILTGDKIVAYLHPWEFIDVEKYMDIRGIMLFEWLFSGNELVNKMTNRLNNLKKSGFEFVTISDYLGINSKWDNKFK